MSEARAIHPTERLSVTLEAQEWNMVMGGLVELQRSVGAVLGKISQQAQSAQQRGNGLASVNGSAEEGCDGRI